MKFNQLWRFHAAQQRADPFPDCRQNCVDYKSLSPTILSIMGITLDCIHIQDDHVVENVTEGIDTNDKKIRRMKLQGITDKVEDRLAEKVMVVLLRSTIAPMDAFWKSLIPRFSISIMMAICVCIVYVYHVCMFMHTRA